MSWKSVELGDLAVRRGGSVNPKKHPDEIFELFSIPAFDTGKPDIVQGSEIGSSKKAVQPNDVLISRIVPHIRRSWVVGSANGYRQIASGEWIIFRSEEIWPNYLRHYLVCDGFHKAFMRTVSGVGGSLLRARPAEVYKIKVPIPPLPEQKRIAAILDTADALRAKRRETLAQLDTLLQSTFLEMFGDPVTNPKGWSIEKLGEVCDVRDGTHDSPKSVEAGHPLLTSKNFKDGAIDYSGAKLISDEDFLNVSKRSKVDIGDLVMPMIGTIGNPVLIESEPDFAIKNVALIKFPNTFPDNRYIREILCSHYFNHITSKANRGNAQKFVALKDLRSMPIPMPPHQLQARFATIVQSAEQQKSRLRAHLDELDTLFASLQARAFAGEL